MRQHVAVQRVQRGIVDVRSEDTLAEIIEHDHSRGAADATKGLLMQLGPGLRTGAEDQQSNRLPAATKRQHEEASAPVLAGVRIANHRTLAVIDLSLFTGRGFDDRTSFWLRGALQFPDEAPNALIAAGEAAEIHQVLPDAHGVAALGESDFDRVAVGCTGAGRGTAAGFWLGR